ncbi:DNA modification methylase [Leucobacter sp. W1153]|uniref:DNA modification methylase n=1 Tax=unclassified Leucobacter TaxID=2621730 RepID=UPI003F3283F1
MKTRRIASSIALAAAITLGATGCGFAVPQATTEPYAPSDGIDVSVAGVEVRNLLLIADEESENFNVVFTGVNTGTTPLELRITFVGKGGSTEASADFTIDPGSTIFGDPEGDVAPVLVSIPDLAAGDTVSAFLQVPGGADVEREVPVLDGTLLEYRSFVISPSDVAEEEELSTESVDANNTDTGAEGAAE